MLGLYLGLIALYIWFWLFMTPETPILTCLLFPFLLVFWVPLLTLQNFAQAIDRAVDEVGHWIHRNSLKLERMEIEWSISEKGLTDV